MARNAPTSRGVLAAAAAADAPPAGPSRRKGALRIGTQRGVSPSADHALCSTTRWPPASIQRRSAASRPGNMLQRREPMTSVASAGGKRSRSRTVVTDAPRRRASCLAT